MLEMTLGAIGGLGLFLYGMNLMADGLQKAAGDRLKEVIHKLTSNRLMAVLVGTFVTMIIQSSSATSVMVVSFVNAGLMTLSQAVGVIFGANIGTTITGQMVSLNLTQFAPIAIATGFLVRTISKKKNNKELADILIGFGILFIGMNLLKEALMPLKESTVFSQWISTYGNNPIIALFIGIIMTLALQSSSATIGVLIALASNGILPFSTAIYIIFGDNIGTCTTALISSLSTSVRGKRVAFIHLLFNIIGTIYFMLFLVPILTNIVTSIDPTDISRQIANAHSLFNIINVIVLFPFASVLVKMVYQLFPETEEEKQSKVKIDTYLDRLLLNTPSMAFNSTLFEFVAMANEAGKTLRYAIDSVKTKNLKSMDRAFKHEHRVNQYEKDIIAYLVELSQQDNISSLELQRIDHLFSSIHDIERISDHAENIAEFAKNRIDFDLLDKETLSDLDLVFETTLKCYNYAIDAISTGNHNDVRQVIELERDLDRLVLAVRDKHILRMNKKIATPESGVYVMDLLSNLERVTDHSRNIAEAAEKTGTTVTSDAVALS